MIIPTPAVYAITNTKTGKQYIGGASYPAQRWYEHKGALKKGLHRNPELQRDWNELGVDCFTFEILEQATKETLSEREDFYISKAENKYNIMDGYAGRIKINVKMAERVKKFVARSDNPAKYTEAKKESNKRGQRTIRDGNEAAALRDGWASAGDALKAWRKGTGRMIKTKGE